MNTLAEISEGGIIAIATSVLTLLSLIVKSLVDIKNRDEDRKDRKQLAELTQEQLDTILKAGGSREKKIVNELIQTRQVNIRALKEANGVNKKIESLGQQLVDGAEQKADPQQ